jgi:hypothetical protein
MGMILTYALEGGAMAFLVGVAASVVLSVILGPDTELSHALAAVPLFFALPAGGIGLAIGTVLGIIKRFKQRGGKQEDHATSVDEG